MTSNVQQVVSNIVLLILESRLDKLCLNASGSSLRSNELHNSGSLDSLAILSNGLNALLVSSNLEGVLSTAIALNLPLTLAISIELSVLNIISSCRSGEEELRLSSLSEVREVLLIDARSDGVTVECSEDIPNECAVVLLSVRNSHVSVSLLHARSRAVQSEPVRQSLIVVDRSLSEVNLALRDVEAYPNILSTLQLHKHLKFVSIQASLGINILEIVSLVHSKNIVSSDGPLQNLHVGTTLIVLYKSYLTNRNLTNLVILSFRELQCDFTVLGINDVRSIKSYLLIIVNRIAGNKLPILLECIFRILTIQTNAENMILNLRPCHGVLIWLTITINIEIFFNLNRVGILLMMDRLFNLANEQFHVSISSNLVVSGLQQNANDRHTTNRSLVSLLAGGLTILSNLHGTSDSLTLLILLENNVYRLAGLVVTKSIVNEIELIVETELLEDSVFHELILTLHLYASSVAIAVAIVSANELRQIQRTIPQHVVSSGNLVVSQSNEITCQVTTLRSGIDGLFVSSIPCTEDILVVRPSLVSNDKSAVLCGSDESPVRRNVDFLLVNSLLVVQSNLREDTSLQKSIDFRELASELNGENASKCLVPRILVKSFLHRLDEIVHTVVSTGASLSLVGDESNLSAFDVSVPGVQVIVSNTALANVDGSSLSVLSPNLLEGQLLVIGSPRSVIQSGKLDSLDTAVEELGLQIDAGEHLRDVEIKHVNSSSTCESLGNLLISLLHSSLDSIDSLSILVDTESSCLKSLNTLGQRSNGCAIVKILSELINLTLKILLGSVDSTLKILLLILKSFLLSLKLLLHVTNFSVNTFEVLLHLLVELLESIDLSLHLLDSSGISSNST